VASKSRAFYGLAAALVLFAIYLATLCPTIEVGDSGELTTAAATLGIAHPPGYPLWCLVVHPFTRLPFAEPALGANLASALHSALASFLFFLLAVGPCAVPVPIALPLALVHGLGAPLWSQSVYAEVYALNLALVLVACLLHFAAPRFDRFLPFWLALVLVSHGSNVLIVAFLAAAWLRRQWRGEGRGLRLAGAAALAALGFTPLLYLPLRAARNPVLDWGHPADLAGFLDHVLRRQYGGFALGGLSDWGIVLATWGKATVAAGSIVALGFAAFALWRERRKPLGTLAALFVLAGPLATFAVAGSLEGRQLEEASVFFLPSFSFLLLLAGRGVALAFRGRWLTAGALVVAAWATTLAVTVRPAVDKRGNYVALDYARALVEPLPQDAVLFVDADHEGLPLTYVQGVLGVRRDVSVRTLEGPRNRDLFGKRTHRPGAEARDRPLFVTVPKAEFAAMPLVPQGLVFRCGDATARPSFSPVVLRRRPGTHPTPFERSAHASLLFHEAAFAFAAGEAGRGLSLLDEAAQLVPEQERLLSDLGVMAAVNGHERFAREVWRRALAINPRYRLAVENLLELEIRAGDRDAARRVVDDALRADPGWQEMRERQRRLGVTG